MYIVKLAMDMQNGKHLGNEIYADGDLRTHGAPLLPATSTFAKVKAAPSRITTKTIMKCHDSLES